MNLVRWFRRNTKKLMAVFVVAIMLAFVMPTVLQQLSRPSRGKATVAYYGSDGRITNVDLASARMELQLLQVLFARQFLLSQQDYRLVLLGELLFHDTATAAFLSKQVNSTLRTRQWPASSRKINDFFAQTKALRDLGPINWLLLKAEAEQAGILISKSFAGQVLNQTVPQLTEGQLNATQLVSKLVEQQNISEDAVLETFGQLLAVAVYAQTITSTESLTAPQLMHIVRRYTDKIDIEFVKFDSAFFAQSQPEPTQAELAGHFEKYRGFFQGQITPQNAYGFGYKSPETVQLEYIALKLDDVTPLVEPPTPEQAEDFYQRYRENFVENVPLDPNDPNSNMTERIKTYAEVADLISEKMLQDEVNKKAELILSEAKALTEAGYQNLEEDERQISDEEFQKLAGDYKEAAEQAGKKNNIKIYMGKTGLLTAKDLVLDTYFGILYVEGQDGDPVSPTKIVFSLEQLDVGSLGPYEIPRPRIYENIGPLKDGLQRIMALIRVIRAEKPTEPTDINHIYDKTGFELIDGPVDQDARTKQPLIDTVTEDLKRLKAMAKAESEAEEFLNLVRKEDWDKVIEKFNKRYARMDKREDPPSEVIELQQLTDITPISNEDIETAKLANDDSLSAKGYLYRRLRNQNFIDRLFALTPKDKTSPENLPMIMPFEPETSFYVIKNLTRRAPTREEYEMEKIASAYREETIQSQVLAFTHYNPENILKRMKFHWAGAKQPDANEASTEPNGVLL